MSSRLALPVSVAAAALVLALSGCATSHDSPEPSAPPSATVDDAARALLPEDVLSSGVLTVGVAPTMGEPWTYQDAGTQDLKGLNVDLTREIAQTLGLEAEFVPTSFDNLVPGLASKRWNATAAPMLDTAARQEVADFVNYLDGGSAFLVAAENEDTYPDLSLETICGLTVGATKGSAESSTVITASDTCVTNNEEAVTISEFDGAADGLLAVISGRVDAYVGAVAQMDYAASGNEKLARSGSPYNSGFSSMGFDKGSEITAAVQLALQASIDSGRYKAILGEYGVEALALTEATVNAGGS